ncbi:MAG TPA: RHS repeat protein, partial [Chromatiaceae bacterium]|nr:RHS repeat protein [Chromatiaceae bacterium]
MKGRQNANLRNGFRSIQQHPRRQLGAAAAEFLVALPALLLLGLGSWQAALLYNAKTTLNYATFEAARVGAVEHAQSDAMRTELGLRLAPLMGGDGSPEKAIAAITRASLDVQDSRFAKIEIISPTQEAFDDFGTEIVNPSTGETKFGIPNSHLRYRDRNPKANSGVNIQDANLLKIKTTYGYKLNVPLMDRVIPAVMRKVDPGNSQFYNAGRMPITSVATVRMQSDAWKDANGNAGGGNGNGQVPTQDPGEGDPGNNLADNSGQGGEPEPDPAPGDDTATPIPSDPFTPDNGGCQSCQQASNAPQSSPVPNSSPVPLIDPSNANSQSCPVNTRTGNPIHVVTGNKYQQETDLKTLPGSLGLSFNRNYNSQTTTNGVLGHNWSHDYQHQLTYHSDTDRYQLKQGDGRSIRFTAGEQPGQYLAQRAADGWLTTRDNSATWHLRDGRKLHYNEQGKLQKIIAADGKSQSLHYNAQHQLFLIRDPQGRELALAYYPNGRLKQILDPEGKTIRYRYDEQGNLASVTYADGTQRHYHYEDPNHPHALTGITDQRGIRYASWAYDEQGRAIESSHIDHVGKVTLDFSTEGQTRITDSQGKQSVYYTEEKNGSAIVTRIDGPGCSSCGNGDVQYEYNDQLQLTKVIKKNGDTTHYVYDEQGRTTRITKSTLTGESHLIARYEYQENNLKPSAIIRPSVNPAGAHRIEIQYNAQHQPIQITEHGYRPEADHQYTPISRTTQLRYTHGDLTTIDGPRDDVKDLIHLSYDSQHRLKTLTGPDGRPLSVKRYDAYGRPTQIQSGSQSPITIGYTDQGQIATVSQYNQSVHYRYTATGKLKSLTTPDGETLSIDYDAADRAVGLTGPDGRRIEDQIDSEGRLVQRNLLGANGQLIQSLSHLYDAKGRLQSTRQNGQLAKQYDYDENGRLIQITDANGNNTQINYGPLGQLQSLIAPDQSQISLHYDDKGQTIGLTDPRNNTTTQLKDDFGNIVKQSHPD